MRPRRCCGLHHSVSEYSLLLRSIIIYLWYHSTSISTAMVNDVVSYYNEINVYVQLFS